LALSTIKRVSPKSKVILTDFDSALHSLAKERSVDAYLDEEFLVTRLLRAARRLALESQPAAKGERRGLRSRPNRRKHPARSSQSSRSRRKPLLNL
jgi:hypothetical protein